MISLPTWMQLMHPYIFPVMIPLSLVLLFMALLARNLELFGLHTWDYEFIGFAIAIITMFWAPILYVTPFLAAFVIACYGVIKAAKITADNIKRSINNE